MYQSLKQKTFSGLFWSAADLVFNRGFAFFVQIVLARFLLPEDFGIIAMVTVFIALSDSLVDSGFGNALIREREASDRDCSTVFFFNLCSAFVLYFFLCITAPWIADFFREPQLVGILRVLSIVLLINASSLIQKTMLTKRLDFKTQTKISVISSILSGIAAIVLAFYEYGVWALVYRSILMQGMQSILFWLQSNWKPCWAFDWVSFRRLFEFGWKLALSGVINTLYQNMYYLMIGRIYSARDLGYFTNAGRFSGTVSQVITGVVQRVSYPVLSSLQEDDLTLRRGYRKMIRGTMFVMVPIMGGLILVAHSLFIFLFGEKWLLSVPYFQVLCLEGVLYPLHAINLNILQVKGRSDLFLRLEIMKKIFVTAVIIGILLIKVDLLLFLQINVCTSVFIYFINAYYSARFISYSAFQQLKDIFPFIAVAAICGLLVDFCLWRIELAEELQLILSTSTFFSMYFFVLKKFNVEESVRVFEYLRINIRQMMTNFK